MLVYGGLVDGLGVLDNPPLSFLSLNINTLLLKKINTNIN